MEPELKLRVKSGNRAGSVLAVQGPASRIGRNASCVIVLDDGTVSGRHADLHMLEGQWYIRDLGSANGTWIDGQEIAPHEWFALPERCELTMGAVVLEVLDSHLPPGAGVTEVLGEPHIEDGGGQGLEQFSSGDLRDLLDDAPIVPYHEYAAMRERVAGLEAECASLRRERDELIERVLEATDPSVSRSGGGEAPEREVVRQSLALLEQFGESLMELSERIRGLAQSNPASPEVGAARSIARRTIARLEDLRSLLRSAG